MLDGLTKRYGDRTAAAELTFAIPRGAVAGFIGPNGAGKTTTMAMLLGLVRPTAGRATVLGESVRHPERYLHRVGALLEGPALWPGLTAVENLRVLARLGGHAERRIPAVLDLVGLGDRADDRFGRYSLGMKQRLGIAAALLGDPDLLVLDEPSNGLDPAGMREMRDLIGRIGEQDRTVLVSSHLLGELEQICDWLIVIENGRIGYAGEAAAFAAGTAGELTLIPADPADLGALAEVVAGHGLQPVREGDRVLVRLDGDEHRATAARLNAAAAGAGIVLAELHAHRPTLESAYLTRFEKEPA